VSTGRTPEDGSIVATYVLMNVVVGLAYARGAAVACYENLESGDGCQRVIDVAVERDVDLGPAPVDPETIAERWRDVTGRHEAGDRA
jgi:hypothetical protein